MDDSVGVEVVQSSDELLGNFSDFILGETSIVLEYFKQLPLCKLWNNIIWEYFSDQTELMRCFEGIEKKDYILLFEATENLDFLAKIVQVLLWFPSKNKIIIREPFADKLERNNLTTLLSSPFIDLAEWSLPN
jgi:hypothetical protein